jgi:transcriptional regulator with XRE-family HTH domain
MSSRREHVTPPWSEAIRFLLEERGLTQVQLARLAGIDPGTIGHLARGGHSTTETLVKIAKALEVDLAELVSRPAGRDDMASRRDRLVAAVLRELSDDVAEAVADAVYRRRKERRVSRIAERPLPFGEL